MMKKIALLVVAVAFAAAASAQVVVGLQGGFHQQSFHNDLYRINRPTDGSTTVFDSKSTTWLGGLQVGYQITRKIYVGVVGQYGQTSGEENLEGDVVYVDERAHSSFQGMTLPVENHRYTSTHSAWYAGLQAKYEVVRYGNMHFNLMLQGLYCRSGYNTVTEQYTKTVAFTKPNGETERGELEDFGPVDDGNRSVDINVSLRPTLVYEFSQHLSAELSLDFLSIGWVKHTQYIDAYTKIFDESTGTPVLTNLIDPHQEVTTTMYAGLNTLMQTLEWESPMLRLGFNWKF